MGNNEFGGDTLSNAELLLGSAGVLIAASGVILTGVAVIVGVFAILGWNQMQRAAREVARKAAIAELKSDEIRQLINEKVVSEINTDETRELITKKVSSSMMSNVLGLEPDFDLIDNDQP
ncbi:hypothetical protein [Curvivirga aplysinae]|uniref:hypothetical protein n=1 Tax=Curvivirga aplysinae TaxID=2529852 RepID=UPI0012BB62B2|nr:hypothetical protein [Curvivirga aplysinae]MTI09249.1 hypothetical protein [Curvivirga aplysinae]